MTDEQYNAMELMICCAARCLEDGKTVAVGTGVPCAAAMLAQRTHAPNLVILFEAGGVSPQLPTMPISVGDSRTFYRGVMATSMAAAQGTPVPTATVLPSSRQRAAQLIISSIAL